ncbi:hypothetical protein ACS0TY_002682 [Phlomoides rotata]
MAVNFSPVETFGSFAPLGAYASASASSMAVPLLSAVVNCTGRSICSRSRRSFKLSSTVVKPGLLCRAVAGEAGERVEEDDGYLIDDSAGASLKNAQCYDKYLMKSLKKAAEARGHSVWGRGPDDTGSYNSKPHETGFFRGGGEYDGYYGRFFLKWYSGVLIDHADQALAYKRAGRIYLEKCGMSELRKAGEECLSSLTKGKYFDLGLEYIKYWKEHASFNSVISKEINIISFQFLENCALEFHKAKDISSLMKFVRCFHSLESKRDFLKSVNYLEELLAIELFKQYSVV